MDQSWTGLDFLISWHIIQRQTSDEWFQNYATPLKSRYCSTAEDYPLSMLITMSFQEHVRSHLYVLLFQTLSLTEKTSCLWSMRYGLWHWVNFVPYKCLLSCGICGNVFFSSPRSVRWRIVPSVSTLKQRRSRICICGCLMYLRDLQSNSLYRMVRFVCCMETGGLRLALLMNCDSFHAVHTMHELKMTGNCLKGTRPLLSFDQVCWLATVKVHFLILSQGPYLRLWSQKWNLYVAIAWYKVAFICWFLVAGLVI